MDFRSPSQLSNEIIRRFIYFPKTLFRKRPSYPSKDSILIVPNYLLLDNPIPFANPIKSSLSHELVYRFKLYWYRVKIV